MCIINTIIHISPCLAIATDPKRASYLEWPQNDDNLQLVEILLCLDKQEDWRKANLAIV